MASSGNGNSSVIPIISEITPVFSNCTGAQVDALISESCLETTDLAEPGLANFKSYTPQYELYTDGATKRRWIYLPEGSQIDTSDPDGWVFPQGTVLWKEFSLGGQKIETRKLEKVGTGAGPASWNTAVYLWLEDQSDAENYIAGVSDENDIKYALANLNSYDFKATNRPDAFDILNLSNNDWLTDPPAVLDEIKGSDVDKQAMGYLHVNCGTCHSPLGSPGIFNLKHSSTSTTRDDEIAYLGAVGVNNYIVPQDPATSVISIRIGNGSMPTGGITIPDTEGQALIDAWINSL